MSAVKLKDPFREAIMLVSGLRVPPPYVRGYSSSDLNDDEIVSLQEWLLDSPSVCKWSTGIGLIDAADMIVESALENGNIEKAWKPSLSDFRECCGTWVDNDSDPLTEVKVTPEYLVTFGSRADFDSDFTNDGFSLIDPMVFDAVPVLGPDKSLFECFRAMEEDCSE